MRSTHGARTTEYDVKVKKADTLKYGSLRLFFLLVEVLKKHTESERDAMAITDIRSHIVDYLDEQIICKDAEDFDKSIKTEDAIERNIRRLLNSIIHSEESERSNDILWKALGGHIIEIVDGNTRKYYFLKPQNKLINASKVMNY